MLFSSRESSGPVVLKEWSPAQQHRKCLGQSSGQHSEKRGGRGLNTISQGAPVCAAVSSSHREWTASGVLGQKQS